MRARDEGYVKVTRLVIYLTTTKQIPATILAFIARQYWPLLAYTGLWPVRPPLSSFSYPALTQP